MNKKQVKVSAILLDLFKIVWLDVAKSAYVTVQYDNADHVWWPEIL